MSATDENPRTFKTVWFSKAARKSLIGDEELCEAVAEVMMGQADDLGGGVFKKRLNRNRHRSIILAKGGRYWIYQFLFAKKDQANITDRDLANFRLLAKGFAALDDKTIAARVADRDLLESCSGDQE